MLVKTFGAAVQGINATIATYIQLLFTIIYISLYSEIRYKTNQ